MMLPVLLVVALVALHTDAATERPPPKSDVPGHDEEHLLNSLLRDYIAAAPPYADQATEVKLGIYINSFYDINEQDMEYSISYYLRMSWTDPRLAFDKDAHHVSSNLRAPNGFWDKIWTPDVFMRNEKKSSDQSIITPQRLLKIDENGNVWYVTKMTTTLSCPMKLQKFPFDTQNCPLMFESFGYTMDIMSFGWLDSPVEVDKAVMLPDYTLEDVILYDCSQNYTGGAFPCLEIRFVLSRDRGYYIMQIYVPSMVLVIVSWLQFWLKPEAVTGRVLVGLFSTFTLVAQVTGIREALPRISYFTSLDVWMIVCLFFVFATLLELVLVIFLDNRSESEKKKSSWIDIGSRVAFPIAFLVFNIIYWSLYASPV